MNGYGIYRHPALAVVWLAIACLTPVVSYGQIFGNVHDAITLEPLPGAVVKVEGSSKGTLTDSVGNFELRQLSKDSDAKIRVSFAGYEPLELECTPPCTLSLALSSHEGKGIQITDNKVGLQYANTAINTEIVGREFMRSIPGNNGLMETIDYVNGLRQQINCGVCGTNDIHINGMEGPYTLVLIDGMPIVSALGSVYALNGIPQSMIERIEITKGPTTAMYGAEAMGGVVNVITRDPKKMPVLGLETNVSSQGKVNNDVALSAKIGKATTLLSGNFHHLSNRIDHNRDNFTDVPLSNRVALFNKWRLDRKDHRIATIALKFYRESRFGGELQWQRGDEGSDIRYGEAIQTRRLEALGSYQLPIPKENVRFDFSAADHFQDSYYGTKHFLARQFTGYSALLWQKAVGRHRLENGATLRYNYYEDNTPATASGPDHVVLPGVFAQDEIAIGNRLTVLLGTRLDYHDKHGLIFSPRLNLRLRPTAFTNIRLTGGRGFRTVNLFTEEHAALTGARDVLIVGNLRPERSYNVNLNFNHVLNIGGSAATVDADVFYNYFSNRILPDYESDPALIIYRNLDGHSKIRGIAAKWSQSFKFPLTLDVGGTWMQSFVVESGTRSLQKLTPVFQGVFSVSYNLKKLRTTVGLTGKVIGPMELPTYSPPFERPTRSDWFTEQNIQLSTNVGHGIGLQIGCRNIWNYTQPSPLIDPAHPFGDAFDTAYAYGPLQTRRLIFGINWQMERKEKAE